jgi:hypothetical protein
MALAKVTFTLDHATLTRLGEAAQRLARPKSQIVREAIHDFHERMGRLGEGERLRLLRVFDEVVPRIPERPLAEVHKELTAIRRARRAGGRRSRGAAGR